MFTSLVANPPRTRSRSCCIGEGEASATESVNYFLKYFL
jgi:hypothetical protein